MVGFLMKLFQLLSRWLLVARESDLGIHRDTGQPRFPVLTLFQMPDGLVLVTVDNKTTHRCDGQKRQHVTTRERSSESFLGIDAVDFAEIIGRGAGIQGLPAAGEPPFVRAGIFLVAETAFASLPRKSGSVLTHGISSRQNDEDSIEHSISIVEIPVFVFSVAG